MGLKMALYDDKGYDDRGAVILTLSSWRLASAYLLFY